MSGGSHGYLGHCWTWEDVLEKSGYLPEVADRLDELGYQAAAQHTRTLHNRITVKPERLAELIAVWGAVDYLDSFDWGPDQVRKAVDLWYGAVRAAAVEWEGTQEVMRRAGLYSATLHTAEESDLAEPYVSVSLSEFMKLFAAYHGQAVR
ncbi:hypothetical protein ACFZAM_32000 [Streptomyces sp. NPDC008079]|uniref:hypothetical protein n=1 Tax=Streptomyces sp. NPDC008079 TaxID=3364806 RepID=UPI0036F173B4